MRRKIRRIKSTGKIVFIDDIVLLSSLLAFLYALTDLMAVVSGLVCAVSFVIHIVFMISMLMDVRDLDRTR